MAWILFLDVFVRMFLDEVIICPGRLRQADSPPQVWAGLTF